MWKKKKRRNSSIPISHLNSKIVWFVLGNEYIVAFLDGY